MPSSRRRLELPPAFLCALSCCSGRGTAIRNVYPYVSASHFKTGKIGFSGETGARAAIALPAPSAAGAATGPAHTLVLEAIDGAAWQAGVAKR